MPEVAIIGGGASGMMCAVSLKKERPDISVTVFEHNNKVLKKILVTGNGRCNILNINSKPSDYYEAADFVADALAEFPPESNIDFFRSLGLLCSVEDEGRVYPLSQSASSVACILRNSAANCGVKVKTDTDIKSVDVKGNKYILNNELSFDCVAFGCGGAASPKQGSDGKVYDILKKLGVKINSLSPSLTGINISDMPFSLKGVRRIGKAVLFCGEKKLASDYGEIQFNDSGLSGIPIMRMSRFVLGNGEYKISLDIMSEYSEKEIIDFLNSARSESPSGEVLCGLLPQALANYVLLMCSVKKDKPFSDVGDNTIIKIAETMKNLCFSVSSAKGFESAQVTRGGAENSEFNSKTMENKKHKHMYVIGETLDVDGACGGYNLGWAWSSARAAAAAISKEL